MEVMENATGRRRRYRRRQVMNDIWRRTFLLFAETEEHQAKIAEAGEKLRIAIDAHEKPYCSYSGGKDSTVLLWLVLQTKPDMMVLHIDFGRWLMPRAIYREIVQNAKITGTRNLRIETSPQWERAKRNIPKGGIFGKILFGRIEPALKEEGFDCCLLGLRAEESQKRKARTTRQYDYGIIDTAYPISELSWMDVWATIVANRLPYLSHYDRMAEIGIGYDQSRISSFFTPGRGEMAVHKTNMPNELYIDS